MSTVDHSIRRTDGSIDQEATARRIMIVDDGSIDVGNVLAAAMALAGSALPILAPRQRLFPPKRCPAHVRHQGSKECQRRLKRLQGGGE